MIKPNPETLNVIIERYRKYFEKKQDIVFEFWVSDEIGGVAAFANTFFFNFEDIRRDIDTDQPKGQILEWHEESVNQMWREETREIIPVEEREYINYSSWCKGARYKKTSFTKP